MDRSSAGFTLIELLTVVAVIGILSAITLPGLMRARIAGNEASAIGSLRVMHTGQHSFWTSCGAGHYALSLQTLGSLGFVPADLSGPVVRKSGYAFSLGSTNVQPGTSCAGSPWSGSYQATADPQSPGSLGQRYFGINTSGTIFQAAVSLTGTIPEMGAPAGAKPVN